MFQERGDSGTYYGETSRTAFERSLEHQALMEAGSLESPMVEHHQEAHPEEELKVAMEVVRLEPKPLHRKTLEGMKISEHKGGFLMNRRGEWGQNLPPKFGVLGRDGGDEDGLNGGNRKRVQDRPGGMDARPAKKRRDTQTVTPEAEPSTSGKSRGGNRPRVDANHGSLLLFFKPIQSNYQCGEQDPESSFQNIEQLSLLGQDKWSQSRLDERESGQEQINRTTLDTKIRRNKLPDS